MEVDQGELMRVYGKYQKILENGRTKAATYYATHKEVVLERAKKRHERDRVKHNTRSLAYYYRKKAENATKKENELKKVTEVLDSCLADTKECLETLKEIPRVAE